ncbi:MAG: hypothetical protein ACKVIH_08765 [Burkholderiales bacterium]
MRTLQSLSLFAVSALLATAALADSSNDPPVTGAKPVSQATKSAPSAITSGATKTRAAVQAELEAYRKNPVSHDGYCIDQDGEGSSRYVGSQGKC